ncbi:MAG: hypothetical protein M3Q39_13840 [Actinomycetota bacterium]|nr:hypothetical protein [Actinomycetota bacterium]
MTTELVPGSLFPDLELPDVAGNSRTLSEAEVAYTQSCRSALTRRR